MRSLLFGASAIALMTPASAIAGEAYVGVSGGLVLPENSRNQGEFDTTVPAVVDGTTEVWGAIPAGTDLEWTTEFQEGWQAGGVIGYAFDNGLRAEIEGFYNEVDVDQHYDIAVGGANIGPADASVLLRTVDPAGHADRSGSVTYNVGLSERRNEEVQGYLTARGIPGGRISSEAFGESMPRVDTADGVRELQNRRVEITYGPGSGN